MVTSYVPVIRGATERSRVNMAERNWLLLAYKVPRKPSASRVYVWRKLKQLGAVAIQDGVWVLPDTPRTKEQFRWLAAEIVELDGEAMLWEGGLALKSQEETFVRRFETEVNVSYAKILSELKHANPNLPDLSRRFQEVQARDFLQSKLGEQVRKLLLKAKDRSER
jgi:hypothetical protein